MSLVHFCLEIRLLKGIIRYFALGTSDSGLMNPDHALVIGNCLHKDMKKVSNYYCIENALFCNQIMFNNFEVQLWLHINRNFVNYVNMLLNTRLG